jgi:hypothetical protein
LGGLERALRLAIPARVEDARAIRQGGERVNAEVYPGRLAGGQQRLYWHIGAGEADAPPIRFFRDRDRLERTLQRARPPNGNAPDLGQNEEPIIRDEVQCRAVTELLVGEGAPTDTRLIARESGSLSTLDTTEERLVGLVQTGQHILQHMAMDGGILWHSGANVLEFGFLLKTRAGDPHALPGGDALFQRRVVERATQSKHTPKRPLLFRRGLEFVLVGLAYRWLFHAFLFRLVSAKVAIKRTSG